MTPTAVKTGPVFANHIERAKAILAGTYEPEPLRLPPDVQEWFDAEVKRWEPPGTREAVVYQHNRLLLDELYGGQDVVYTTTPSGSLAILATGLDEIRELYGALTPEEARRAIMTLPGVSRE